MKRKYIVETHVGDFETFAVSEAKAITNVRYRVFGRKYVPTKYWTAREA